MSYDRMKQKESELEAKVQELLARAAAADAEEDATCGKDRRGDQLPADLRRAEERLAKIRALRRELEAEAQAQAEAAQPSVREDAEVAAVIREAQNVTAALDAKEQHKAPPAVSAPGSSKAEPGAVGDDGDDDDHELPTAPAAPAPEEMPHHQIPRTRDDAPSEKAQRSFTDADSRIMKSGDGFIQAYNVQAAVDAAFQIVVALAVSNQPPDAEHLVPMLDRVVESCGRPPDNAIADAGYFSENNVERVQNRGIDACVATGRIKHDPPSAPPTVVDDDSAKDRMRRKLATDEGRAVYARRKAIVEPVFGQMKNRGFRQFLLRGIEKVRGEMALIGLSHNLLKLHTAKAPA